MVSCNDRVFCVHSKRRPLHAAFYDALGSALKEQDISLTHYDEWSWTTPGGKSISDLEREHERDIYDHQRGVRDLHGLGRIQNPPLDLELALTRQKFPPPEELNQSDLSRLISGSRCLILLEEDGQDALSEGMMVEWSLLQEQGGRMLNARICGGYERAYQRTIFPFSEGFQPNSVIAVRKTDLNGMKAEDIELVTFVLALWCDDKAGRDNIIHQQGQRVYSLDISKGGVRITGRGMYLYALCRKLAMSDDPNLRRVALLNVAALRDLSLRLEMCKYLARTFIDPGSPRKHMDDYFRFMELTPDMEWTEVVDAINRRR
jgi:hypothetical protein